MDSLTTLCAKKIVTSLPKECRDLIQRELLPRHQEYHLDRFVSTRHPPSQCWYLLFEIRQDGCYDEMDIYYYGITSNPMTFLTSRIFPSSQYPWLKRKVKTRIDQITSQQDRVWIEAYCIPRLDYANRFILFKDDNTHPSRRTIEIIFDHRHLNLDTYIVETSWDILKQDQDNDEYWSQLGCPYFPMKYYIVP